MDFFDKFTQKIIPFKVPFISDSTETLHYLEKIRQNEVKNSGATLLTQYRTIIYGLRSGREWSDTDSAPVNKRHKTYKPPCPYGKQCRYLPNCRNYHPFKHKNSTNSKSPKMPPCRYGRNCTNSNCKFLHSGGNNNQKNPRNKHDKGGTGGGRGKITCYRCGKVGHVSNECKSTRDINGTYIKSGTWQFKPKSGSDFRNYNPNANPNHALHDEQKQHDANRKYVWHDGENSGKME